MALTLTRVNAPLTMEHEEEEEIQCPMTSYDVNIKELQAVLPATTEGEEKDEEEDTQATLGLPSTSPGRHTQSRPYRGPLLFESSSEDDLPVHSSHPVEPKRKRVVSQSKGNYS